MKKLLLLLIAAMGIVAIASTANAQEACKLNERQIVELSKRVVKAESRELMIRRLTWVAYCLDLKDSDPIIIGLYNAWVKKQPGFVPEGDMSGDDDM